MQKHQLDIRDLGGMHAGELSGRRSCDSCDSQPGSWDSDRVLQLQCAGCDGRAAERCRKWRQLRVGFRNELRRSRSEYDGRARDDVMQHIVMDVGDHTRMLTQRSDVDVWNCGCHRWKHCGNDDVRAELRCAGCVV